MRFLVVGAAQLSLFRQGPLEQRQGLRVPAGAMIGQSQAVDAAQRVGVVGAKLRGSQVPRPLQVRHSQPRPPGRDHAA